MKNPYISSEKGYALLVAIFATSIFSILILTARAHWETEIRRDLEAELIFRGRQYVNAIERFVKKNNNLFPQSLEVLYDKKFIRRSFPDPMTESGTWNLVMRPFKAGSKQLLIVAEAFVPKMLARARIIGVSSTSTGESYREYRKKKQYHEWAFYLGEKVEEEMPKLEFITH